MYPPYARQLPLAPTAPAELAHQVPARAREGLPAQGEAGHPRLLRSSLLKYIVLIY